MAWKASGVVDQRRKFVQEYESGEWTMAELCREYEISRESGYKWIKRIRGEGEQGLEHRSRAPRCHRNQTDANIEQQVLQLRRRHATWGPRKLLYTLQQEQPQAAWPAASKVGALLKCEELTVAGRARRKEPEKTTTWRVGAICEAAFREHGLPLAIRTDNGPPFASRAVAGLSVLSIYWMKLGIIPERIVPGHPEQNGRHRRIHRDLKAETGCPPAG